MHLRLFFVSIGRKSGMKIKALRESILSGRTTAEAVTRGYLERIAKWAGKEALNAVAAVNPRALDEARELDAHGDRSLPLFGVPVLVKDNIDVAGMVTSAGSLALADNVAAKDARIVKNLRKSGAVILGKTNLTEFANYTSSHMPAGFSSYGGQVRNAYDVSVSPSGSSSGSGVAMSADLCAAAVGTDTSFSVIHCAMQNGITGLKPVHGGLSAEGIVPLCRTMDSAGPMTEDLEDALILYAAMRGEPLCMPQPIPTDKLRICVNRNESIGFGGEHAAKIEAFIDKLRAAGAMIGQTEERNHPCFQDIMKYEFKHDLEEYLAQHAAKRKTLGEIIAYYHEHPDAMPHGIDTLEKVEHDADGRPEDTHYLEAMKARAELQRHFDEQLGDYDACILLGVHCNMHVAGLPCVTLRLGMAENGLPLGLILYGTNEARLFGAALTMEKLCEEVVPPVLDK